MFFLYCQHIKQENAVKTSSNFYKYPFLEKKNALGSLQYFSKHPSLLNKYAYNKNIQPCIRQTDRQTDMLTLRQACWSYNRAGGRTEKHTSATAFRVKTFNK